MNAIKISSQDTLEDSLEHDTYDIERSNFKRPNNEDIETNVLPKRLRSNDNNMCSGLIIMHMSYGSRDFSVIKNTRAKNVKETTSNLRVCFEELIQKADIFHMECEEENYSQGMMFDSKNESSFINHSNQSNFNAFSGTTPFSETASDQKFKFPSIGQVMQTNVFMHTHNQRLSSSTSSSSQPPNSRTSGNRCSTASSTSQSCTSGADIIKTDSDEQMVIYESSDSALYKNEEIKENTLIKSDDNSEYIYVYAKWKTDKFYYSGRVKESCAECEVLFDDKSSEIVKITDILFKELLPIGTEVSVDINNQGNFTKNFIIKNHEFIPKFRSKPRKGYSVLNQLTHQYLIVPRECVCVHMDIIRKIMGKSDMDCSLLENLDSSDISMDNILFGKRTSKPKRYSQYLLNDWKPKRCLSPSITNISNTTYESKSRYYPRKVTGSSILERGIFANCFFMITGGKEEDENSDLSKESIEKVIQAHNGNIIEVPSQDLVKKYKNSKCKLFLIVLGEVSQTVKFMMALAIGQMPIVKSEWLFKCVQQTKLIDSEPFLLFRGVVDNVEQKINLEDQGKAGLFYNKNIWIVTDNLESFGKNWQTILELAGAEAFIMDTSNFSSSISSQICNFVVAEKDGVTNNCLRKLRSLEISVLNISFITDSLIRNAIQEMDNYILS